MTDDNFLSLGLTGPSHPTPDTQADPSHSEAPMMQLQIEAPLPLFFEHFVPPPVYHPQPYTPGVEHVPDNYTQWCAEMFGQSSFQPMPDHSSWGTPIQQTESFDHMSDSVPPSAYEARRTEVLESDDSGDVQLLRGHIEGGLDRGRRETRPPPCGTGGCVEARVVRRGRGCGRE
ncbi:hypothetical protein PIB30_065437 [Stylosanthes scabra]|uniref:Uncharacterized protein n=1 Tax=Stylosanthes scabra TaxID=79078 RepID=A0ABU6TLS1_9FABA|nr:hypothetical protein [Stylosanthes scabra]